MNNFDESLKALDLHGIMMVQGLLVNRALQILHEQKEAESKIVKPNGLLIPKINWKTILPLQVFS